MVDRRPVRRVHRARGRRRGRQAARAEVGGPGVATPGRSSTPAARPRPHCCWHLLPRRSPIARGCGACWPWLSTGPRGRPRHWRPCVPCAPDSSRTSGSTRPSRHRVSSGQCWPRTSPSPRPAPAPHARQTTTAVSRAATPGRARFTASAVALLDDASAAGEVRYLLVSGEAGIGKTRLVGDLAAFAAGSGFAVLVGRCHEGDYAPALWPWVTIVRGLPGADDAPELAPLARRQLDARPLGRFGDADVRRGRRAARGQRGPTAPAGRAGGHPLGRRDDAPPAASPGVERTRCAARRGDHPTYRRGPPVGRPGRHDGRPGPRRRRTTSARRPRHRGGRHPARATRSARTTRGSTNRSRA